MSKYPRNLIWHNICYVHKPKLKHNIGDTMDLFEEQRENASYARRMESDVPQDKKDTPGVIESRTEAEWDERIRAMFEASGNDPDAKNEYGVPLLFHAINFGSVEVMKMLLNEGADVNFVSWQGRSPWFLAVESGDMEKFICWNSFTPIRAYRIIWETMLFI